MPDNSRIRAKGSLFHKPSGRIRCTSKAVPDTIRDEMANCENPFVRVIFSISGPLLMGLLLAVQPEKEITGSGPVAYLVSGTRASTAHRAALRAFVTLSPGPVTSSVCD